MVLTCPGASPNFPGLRCALCTKCLARLSRGQPGGPGCTRACCSCGPRGGTLLITTKWSIFHPRMDKDCLHVLKRGLRAESERAGSSRVFLPHITTFTVTCGGHSAHRYQTRESKPRATLGAAFRPITVSQCIPGAEPEEHPIIYMDICYGPPLPRLDQSEGRFKCIFSVCALEFFRPGETSLKGKVQIQSGKETGAENLMRCGLLNGRQMAPKRNGRRGGGGSTESKNPTSEGPNVCAWSFHVDSLHTI